MSEDEFALAAGRLAGLAGVMFGWRPDEFWGATPAELGAVVAALAEQGAGQGDGLSGEDVEGLKRMLSNSPSTLLRQGYKLSSSPGGVWGGTEDG